MYFLKLSLHYDFLMCRGYVQTYTQKFIDLINNGTSSDFHIIIKDVKKGGRSLLNKTTPEA